MYSTENGMDFCLVHYFLFFTAIIMFDDTILRSQSESNSYRDLWRISSYLRIQFGSGA